MSSACCAPAGTVPLGRPRLSACCQGEKGARYQSSSARGRGQGRGAPGGSWPVPVPLDNPGGSTINMLGDFPRLSGRCPAVLGPRGRDAPCLPRPPGGEQGRPLLSRPTARVKKPLPTRWARLAKPPCASSQGIAAPTMQRVPRESPPCWRPHGGPAGWGATRGPGCNVMRPEGRPALDLAAASPLPSWGPGFPPDSEASGFT